MADPKRALILHLTHGGEPLVFALATEEANDLDTRLTELVADGRVHTPTLADGSTVVVNFGHVVTAHLDELPPHVRVYGSGDAKRHGFV